MTHVCRVARRRSFIVTYELPETLAQKLRSFFLSYKSSYVAKQQSELLTDLSPTLRGEVLGVVNRCAAAAAAAALCVSLSYCNCGSASTAARVHGAAIH